MLLGVDVSEYQGLMNWPKAKEAGAQFAYFRVGYGPDGIDDQLVFNRLNAPAILPTGGYWAFNPSWPALEQADLFCDELDRWNWKLRPWADVELEGTTPIIERTQALENFILRIIQRTRVVPVIYTRAVWFNDHILRHLLWNCCDLAVARYCQLDHPWGDGNCVPLDWDDFLFWQWSADGNGRGAEFGAESDSIDLDWYTGVLPGFGSKLTVKSPTWLRRKGSESGAIVGSTWNGRTLDVVERVGGWVKVNAWIREADERG